MNHEAMRARVLQVIEEHGFQVQSVFPAKGDTRKEWFCYTVGLTGFDHPELISYNLDPDTAAMMLNYLGQQVMTGRRFDADTSTTEVNRRGHPIWFIRVDDVTDLTLVDLIYGSVNAVQLVYPDRKGRLPWDAGYRVDKRMPQRLVGAPPARRQA